MARRRSGSATSHSGASSHFSAASSSDSATGETGAEDRGTVAIDKTTWQAAEDELLVAPVELPSKKSLAVKLGPINLIDRLDEYQSDENALYALVGLFGGGALGILVDWAASADTPISPLSVSLAAIFVFITIIVTFFLLRIRSRKESVKKKLRGI